MYNRPNNENPSEENSADEDSEETNNFSSAPTSGSYGSTSVQDESVPRFYVPCCGLVFYIMAFFGIVSALLIRECLSVAIVAMVNQTAVADEDIVVTNVTEDQCPRDPELQSEGGEFKWERNQQAIVLAAFYYGYEFTKVCIQPVSESLIYSIRSGCFNSGCDWPVYHDLVTTSPYHDVIIDKFQYAATWLVEHTTADKIQHAAIWLASISWFSYDVTLWWRHYP